MKICKSFLNFKRIAALKSSSFLLTVRPYYLHANLRGTRYFHRESCKLRETVEPDCQDTNWSIHKYHKQADEFLLGVVDQLETAGEDVASRFPQFDVEYSSGVLTLALGGDHGTFVLNKQPPNRQIWLSSPISGPKRYDFNPNTLQWVDYRTGELLTELLGRELSSILKYSIAF